MRYVITTLALAIGLSGAGVAPALAQSNEEGAEKGKSEVELYRSSFRKATEHIENEEYEKAFKYCAQAAKLGHKQAQYVLATMYLNGEGVEAHPATGIVWLNVAAEAPQGQWREQRDQVMENLSDKEREQLQPHIEKYIEKYGMEAQNVECERERVPRSQRRRLSCTKDSG